MPWAVFYVIERYKTCDSCQKLATGAEGVVKKTKICHNKPDALYSSKAQKCKRKRDKND